MTPVPIPKTRARIEILSHVAQFCLMQDIGGSVYRGLECHRWKANRLPAVGSLVAVQCARPSNWYLSWVVEIINYPGTEDKGYLLESIEDGWLCEWTNVSLLEYNPADLLSFPHWRWSDKQYKLNDRWMDACYKKRGAYLKLPIRAEFTADGGVTLGLRTRMGLNTRRPTRTFEQWPKVTVKMMLEFYDQVVAEEKGLYVRANDGMGKADV